MYLFFSLIVAITACYVAAEPRTFEIMLPMRDGVKLHTRVVFPRDFTEGSKATTVMDRSPYGYMALELLNDIYLPAGFITVGQDMRGTQKSEGNFTIWHSDANDSQDLGDWIVSQSWSDGKIFTFGASADGLASFQTPQNRPAWLDAQYVVWSSSLGYDIIYPNGAYLMALADIWIRSTVPDQADECLQVIAENEYRDEWWDEVELTGKYDRVHAASGFWAGWYDIFLVGNLAAYEGYNTLSDPSVRATSRITVDPLGHCQSGAEYFKQDLIAGRTALAVAQSFETFGVRPVVRTNIKNVTFYVMSSNDEAGLDVGQFWTTLEKWPEPTMTDYYLNADGTVTTTLPKDDSSSTTYVHDPANPIGSMGGNNLNIPCGPLDQKETDERADVITFNTEVFSDALYLTGPLFADLYVSSDAIDTDFMVRLSDVYPTGEVRLIQDSAARMRWRQGGSTPVYMEKGVVYPAHLTLWNTSYIFAPGHALRVAISSSNTPRFDVNPNNGILLADQTSSDPNITASNTVYHSSKYPSRVQLPLVKKAQLPPAHNIKEEVEAAYPFVNWDKVNKEFPEKIFNLVAGRPVKKM